MKKHIKTHVHIGHEEIMNGDPQSIIDPLWWAVSIYDGEKKYNKGLSRFTLPQRYVFAIQWYVSEVNNGGHEQFYFNSTGLVYPDALQGFREIGHRQAYDILNESIARAGGKLPLDRSRRQKLLDKLELEFDDLDTAFYEISDLDGKLMEYIKARETDFYFDGTVRRPDLPSMDWGDAITFAPIDTSTNEN